MPPYHLHVAGLAVATPVEAQVIVYAGPTPFTLAAIDFDIPKSASTKKKATLNSSAA